MIERVARAMWAKYEAITADVTRSQVRPWDEMPQSNRDFWLEVAATGIEAMRIENVIYYVNGQPNASPQDVDWNKRIDAALAERD